MRPRRRLMGMQDEQFLNFAAGELEKIGLIERKDVIGGTLVRVPRAYPAYFGAYSQFGDLRDYLDRFSNLYPIGRNGMHRYNNQDHSMLTANAAVDSIEERRRNRISGRSTPKSPITRKWPPRTRRTMLPHARDVLRQGPGQSGALSRVRVRRVHGLSSGVERCLRQGNGMGPVALPLLFGIQCSQ